MQTPKYLKEKEVGKATEIRIGEMDGGISGIFKMFLKELEYLVEYDLRPGVDNLKNATANTAVLNHSKKTFALHEGNLPFGIQLSKE